MQNFCITLATVIAAATAQQYYNNFPPLPYYQNQNSFYQSPFQSNLQQPYRTDRYHPLYQPQSENHPFFNTIPFGNQPQYVSSDYPANQVPYPEYDESYGDVNEYNKFYNYRGAIFQPQFPPRVEKVVEGIQNYFSVYNHLPQPNEALTPPAVPFPLEGPNPPNEGLPLPYPPLQPQLPQLPPSGPGLEALPLPTTTQAPVETTTKDNDESITHPNAGNTTEDSDLAARIETIDSSEETTTEVKSSSSSETAPTTEASDSDAISTTEDSQTTTESSE